MLRLLIILLYCGVSGAVIFRLNESQYYQMPTLFSMDDYDPCLSNEQGLYCLADYNLFSTSSSPIMEIIKEYSAHKRKHFNYTQLHKGVCVTSTCKHYPPHEFNRAVDLNTTLEACVNETIFNQYGVQAKLAKVISCNRHDEKVVITNSDICVIVICFAVIILNVLGTAYDWIVYKKATKTGNEYIIAFSLVRNWNKLAMPSGKGPDERLSRLKSIHGFRVLTMFLVIFAHGVLMLTKFVDNPIFLEKMSDDAASYIVINGTIATSNFFVMSSFLLVYNFLIHSEKHKITWIDFPKGVLLRWIRLTSTYGLVLACISTFVRHLGDGPFWHLAVVTESDACRESWWTHISYINNYIYTDFNCMIQTWYMAADFQLFTMLLLLLVIVRSYRARKIAVYCLFLLSLVIIAAITYFMRLEATFMQNPENTRVFYADDDTYKQMYIPCHTSISSYAIGFAAALITYKWQNEKKDLSKYKKYRWAYWLCFPAGVAVLISGQVFYIDDYEPSQLVKTLYAVFYRTAVQILFSILMVGCIFKFESLYRSVLEWSVFTWMSRVSYDAFLVHTIFQRYFMGIQTKPVYFTRYYIMVVVGIASVFIAYIAGACLYLLVEAPVTALVKATFTPAKGGKSEKENNQ